jgi:hypothetical protein
MLFFVMHYIRVKKIWFKTWGIWLLKDAEFNAEFKNIDLYSDKMHLKKVMPEKTNFANTQGPPVYCTVQYMRKWWQKICKKFVIYRGIVSQW